MAASDVRLAKSSKRTALSIFQTSPNFEAKTLAVNITLFYTKDVDKSKASCQVNPPKTVKGTRIIPLTDETVYALRKQRAQYEWLRSQIGTRGNLTPVKGFENLAFNTRMATPVCERTIVASIKAVIRRINKNRTTNAIKSAKVTAR